MFPPDFAQVGTFEMFILFSNFDCGPLKDVLFVFDFELAVSHLVFHVRDCEVLKSPFVPWLRVSSLWFRIVVGFSFGVWDPWILGVSVDRRPQGV